jgi:hypothetical protein
MAQEQKNTMRKEQKASKKLQLPKGGATFLAFLHELAN